jgi:phosphomethylpyrimidine synthase
MKITQEVREFAAAKGLAEGQGIAAGMQAKAEEFNRTGGQLYIPLTKVQA